VIPLLPDPTAGRCEQCGKAHGRLDMLETLTDISDDHRHDLNTRLLAEIALFLHGVHHELRKLTGEAKRP
jgi:hypothetical protein